MSLHSVILFTVGEAGSGKTFLRGAHYIAYEFRQHPERRLITGLPLKLDVIRKRYGDGVADRIELIPPEVLKKWMNLEESPAVFFAGKKLHNCHIQIDEIHNILPDTRFTPDHPLYSKQAQSRQDWLAWLGEIRHEGATVEFISQSAHKVFRGITKEAGMWQEIISPWHVESAFDVPAGAWWQLIACFSKDNSPRVYLQPYRIDKISGKRIKQEIMSARRDSDLFELYDSFSAPLKKLNEAGEEVKEERKGATEPYQLGKLRCCLWFMRNYWFKFKHIYLFVLVLGFMFSPAPRWCVGLLFNRIQAITLKSLTGGTKNNVQKNNKAVAVANDSVARVANNPTLAPLANGGQTGSPKPPLQKNPPPPDVEHGNNKKEPVPAVDDNGIIKPFRLHGRAFIIPR